MSLPERAVALAEEAPSQPRRRVWLRLTARAVPGLALLAVLLVGLGSSLWTLVFVRDPELTRIGWHGTIHGALTARVGKTLLVHNPFAHALVTADRVINYAAFGDLGPRVRQGCPGWLFLRDEFAVYPDRAANFATNIDIIKEAAGFLARRHIALALVPVPDKSRVEAQALCGLVRPAVLRDRFRRMVAALRQGGIKVVDILPPLRALAGERFYRTDTHWNERGARCAADAVASRLRAWGLASQQQARFAVATGPPHERLGDLIHLAGLNGVPPPLRPRGDIARVSAIKQVPHAATVPDTVLIGTSFSNMSNFAEFLAVALGAPVDNRAHSGGAITGSARAYFADPSFAKSPPRVIVWEIPERFIEAPLPETSVTWGHTLGEAR